MKPHSFEFLKRLLDTPGPSGFETAPSRIWRTEATTFADHVTTDVNGNSVATLNPDATASVMLAGHIDEIGFMIVHVDEDGYLYFAPIGGWDSQVFVGQRVTIMSRGGPVVGVIGKPAVHLMKPSERDKVSKPTDLWIDIGARDKEAALANVRVGDPGVLDAAAIEIAEERLVSRSIDNRIGAFVVLEALRLLGEDRPEARVHAVATTREEISWTGGGARTSAAALNPTVAVVVDVTHATDHSSIEKKEHGDHALGGGPVLSRGSSINDLVYEHLADVCETEGIPYSVTAAPRDTGTDADMIYSAHHGIATGLVSVPNRYMHSPNEMVDLRDLEHAARLLAAFCRRITTDTTFIPT